MKCYGALRDVTGAFQNTIEALRIVIDVTERYRASRGVTELLWNVTENIDFAHH